MINPSVCDYCNPGYQALPGTRIRRVGGRLILSDFGQGTQMVSLIVTFHAQDDDSLGPLFFMRFDIELANSA